MKNGAVHGRSAAEAAKSAGNSSNSTSWKGAEKRQNQKMMIIILSSDIFNPYSTADTAAPKTYFLK